MMSINLSDKCHDNLSTTLDFGLEQRGELADKHCHLNYANSLAKNTPVIQTNELRHVRHATNNVTENIFLIILLIASDKHMYLSTDLIMIIFV